MFAKAVVIAVVATSSLTGCMVAAHPSHYPHHAHHAHHSHMMIAKPYYAPAHSHYSAPPAHYSHHSHHSSRQYEHRGGYETHHGRPQRQYHH